MLPVAIHTPVEHRHPEPLRRLYAHLRLAVQHRHGTRAPGRDILKHGVKTRKGVRAATHHDLRRSVDTFRRWLHPAATVTAPVAVTSSAQPVTGMPACTWKPESGGDYGAVNPSSGAFGKYQILASTWAAYCTGVSRDPSGQETCARRVLAGQGAGAWVSC